MAPGADVGVRLLHAARELGRQLAQELHGAGSRLSGAISGRGGDAEGCVARIRSRLPSILRHAERDLAENVLPFWARASDGEHGGFITHLDRDGRRLGTTDKYLVMQARLVWTFAAAHRHGLTRHGYLALAGRGVHFLLDKMWDREHGGFFWIVGRDGAPLDTRKRAYGQGFAIYALAEYAAAAGDPRALAWAERTFDLLIAHAADGDLGFREEFVRDWTPAPPPLGERKTLDTHLHLLEMLIALAGTTKREAHAAALTRVLDILLRRVVHGRDRYAADLFDRSWRPSDDWRHRRRVNYGHDAELAWLALEAVDLLGRPRIEIRDRVLGLIDHALAYGFDRTRGGIAHYGPPAGAVTHAIYLNPARLAKLWWPQAEMLVATIEAYRWTGRARYLVAFEKQFEWVWRHQVDHEAGDWFEAVTWREGRPLSLRKGHDWKDAYHQSRAWMEVSRRLRAMGIRPGEETAESAGAGSRSL